MTVAEWQQNACAILEGWLLGRAGGSTTADLLLGEAAPSGRLAETIPLRYKNNPAIGNFPGEHGHVRCGEGLLIGYRWYDTHRMPVAYPFGHGLTYTTFEFTDLTVTAHATDEAEVELRLVVTYTGTRAGTETAQVYVSGPEASVFRPRQELRAFAQVRLDPGQSEPVTLTLNRRAFGYWHTPAHRWVVEPGTFRVAQLEG